MVLAPGAGELPAPSPGEAWVALPGAAPDADAERVPDLGTALRRFPAIDSVRVHGHGLPARDHDAAAGLPLVFEPAPLPDGLQSLELPATAVQGRAFTVRGRLQGTAGGRVEVLDPSGGILATTAPGDDGSFVLTAHAGPAGPTPFSLRWLDADGTMRGEETLRIDVIAPARPRLLALAGGPSPELKYLRRWAVDAGLDLHTVIELGGGVQLGDRPLPINAATLAEFDLVLLDERAWRQLGPAGRGGLREAVREGLGVLVRITGRLNSSDLASLREWGLVLEASEGTRGFRWPDTAPVGGTSVPKGIGTEVPPTIILHDVGFGLEAGDRVGLLGPNGAGKSTLVKTLVGELPLLGGERVAHPDMRIGYFAQHTVESLHEGQSPLWHLKEIAPNAGEQQLRNFLGRWNFVGDRAFENVDGFSGGERARLALAMIAYREPNVLLLDEPTNHLDLDMREALAEALSDFPGAIVLVSHDRHLIGLVCETFWRVADGHVEEFNGDLDEYAAWLRSRGNEPKAPKAAAAAPPPKPAKPARSKHEQETAARRARQLETQVAELAEKLAQVEAQLADPAIYGNDGGSEVGQLTQRQQKLAAEKDALEAEWLAQLEIAEA